ncbi:tight adherence protein C [Actinopolymorpha cephalotaxi]|uniref:Tight adherence protein C n=1 Tax=Actinopolymorpha cephalotaxi TaxID=504797 RepID=A0A1I2KKA3_9ACTN|nr:type II secretion system F family protein [Actinopolymorpha cephalotaxi]NYH84472.1 tight adherence protein C [Actinopolymorpha cephalotaxi]SFF66719.1 tight adherence protein C [Actinopolymorpha cephalotaxi]
MTISWYGALLGLLTGFGLVLAIVRLPVLRRPKLDDRLAPYIRDAAGPAAYDLSDRVFTPFPTLERILRPYFRRGAGLLERVLGGGAVIRRRLQQAGLDMRVEDFRVEQLIWGAAGFAAALAMSLLLLVSRGTNPIPLLILCFAAFVIGILLRDRRLVEQVKKREVRMMAEFPTVADMLALSVTAGEGPVAALERVANVSKGELAREFRFALSEARTGATLVQALESVGDRTNVSILARFVDGIAIAVERGTPLADVLRAQAADVREAGKRELIESGGRKEIGMMVPIVFLVLPVTVLFAFFPGAISLQMVSP